MLDPVHVRDNYSRIRADVDAAARRAGRDPREVEILAAVKYLQPADLNSLTEAGVTLLGENRAQQLLEKIDVCPNAFTWDFIGHLQSRKVKSVVSHVRFIHSVASRSVLDELAKHALPETKVLVEVNLSGEVSKSGIDPGDLDSFIAKCPVEVVGLMTMPPLSDNPESSRPYFARLRDLACQRGLGQLSMGTSQDHLVAVEEGATIVRIGSRLVS